MYTNERLWRKCAWRLNLFYLGTLNSRIASSKIIAPMLTVRNLIYCPCKVRTWRRTSCYCRKSDVSTCCIVVDRVMMLHCLVYVLHGRCADWKAPWYDRVVCLFAISVSEALHFGDVFRATICWTQEKSIKVKLCVRLPKVKNARVGKDRTKDREEL